MLAIDMAELDGMSPRERVFELIMRRLDAMAPYKEGLRTLAHEARRDPCCWQRPAAISTGSAGACSTRRLPTRGPVMTAKLARRVTGAVYLQAFRVWLDDDTPDMARTLAELDRRLQQAETARRWLAGFARFCPRAAKAQAAA